MRTESALCRATQAAILFLVCAVGAARAQDAGSVPDDKYPHGSYREDCSLCHGPDGWSPATISKKFDHGASGFALMGAHGATPCTSCHAALDFGQTPSACLDCHEDIHLGELGVACERCHDTRSFLDRPRMQREHSTFRFPLTGSHLTLDCQNCHSPAAQGQGVYVGTPSDCVACHEAGYDSTTEPDHEEADFSKECMSCHSTLGWSPARFSHKASGFLLTGAHRSEPCSSCHGDGVYQGKDTECSACHTDDYDASTDPDHRDAGFPTSCETCHGTQTWVGATFKHSDTDFPLTGAHVGAACRDCHEDGVYAGKSTLCVDCHRGEYTGSTNPHHVAAQFSTTCQDCHNTSTWTAAPYNHAATGFPLTGAHKAEDCSSCHGDGVYEGKSDDCYDCHRTDYDGARDPNHRTAGFPTDCAACHGTNSWEGAEFDHDDQYFPIYSGRHRSEWSVCSDCHTNSSNYGTFDCLGCHPHSDKRDTDSEHREENGYSYTSTACYRCHPTGREED